MPRANRFYSSDYIWHVTQRCHKGEFLLKLKKDKINWLKWMYKAKNEFHITIFNYILTSNHIHLLVYCDSDENHIARAIHLVSGKVAWDYNHRKGRKGSFWEDRYHATAIQSGQHLLNCMLYIDSNMVRAGVVKHPRDWPYGGYQEIINCKQRFTLINKKKLNFALGFEGEKIEKKYQSLLYDYLINSNFEREKCWTESICVGNKEFVKNFQNKLNINTMRRKIIKNKDHFILRENVNPNPYSSFFNHKKRE